LFKKQRSDDIGYLAWEYPTAQLLQRLPLGKYSAICIILWGLVLSCFAAVNNFSGAVAIRFMLGLCEAAVTPGFALLTSQVCRQGNLPMSKLITMITVVDEEGTRPKDRNMVFI
jgi:hypothetical protein